MTLPMLKKKTKTIWKMKTPMVMKILMMRKIPKGNCDFYSFALY